VKTFFNYIEPWYNVFSYWGFILWLFNPWLPFPVLAILMMNLIGTFFFLLIARPSIQVAVFLILLHAVPVWFVRKQKIDWKSALFVFLGYNVFLAIQGLDFVKVYANLLKEPPVTVLDYLKFRKILL
jgi:hypothetical protein